MEYLCLVMLHCPPAPLLALCLLAAGAAQPLDRAEAHAPAGLAASVSVAATGTPSGEPATARPPNATPEPSDDPDQGVELIGAPAPPWRFARWIGTRPLELEDMRGKVVLVRWWTEGCRFCKSTLPVLERLRRKHEARGFAVVGVFHPKPPGPVSDRHIRAVARELGFHGAIAVDPKWEALDRYWLTARPERNWTSVSFLIDREGVIRWVHGGGEYHPSQDSRHAVCDAQYRELERVLDQVLVSPAP